jgi:non-homologous end joining protein Ku
VRGEAEYFADIPPLELPEDILNITEYILESKRESFDPRYLEDRYRTVVVEKLKDKRAQELPARGSPSTPSARNVINLMEALRRASGHRGRRLHPRHAKSAAKPTAAPAAKPSAKSARKRSNT